MKRLNSTVRGISYWCRITRFIEEQSKTSDYNKEFELPYYHWESNLDVTGNEAQADGTQGFFISGFLGTHTTTRVPNDDKLFHLRMKR